MIVCLDGPAGSGKSTISREVARRAGFIHLDTGAYYRSLALVAMQQGISWDDESGLCPLAQGLDLLFETGETEQRVMVGSTDVTREIRSPEIGTGASRVSRHPRVREILVEAQRRYASGRDVVVEGRDTATVVFPHAELKIYLDASLEVRAGRRLGDFLAQGNSATLESVMQELAARDKRDQEREVAPLTVAPDAVVVDTSDMGPEEVIRHLLDLIGESREA